tara:strand:+ start:66 stop:299 length:234 start_codon:yes stop_codon:yes gene_type:complete
MLIYNKIRMNEGSEIINSEKFDEIFDRVIYEEKLFREFYNGNEADTNMLVEKYLNNNTYKVYYENQLFYILTDSFSR